MTHLVVISLNLCLCNGAEVELESGTVNEYEIEFHEDCMSGFPN